MVYPNNNYYGSQPMPTYGQTSQMYAPYMTPQQIPQTTQPLYQQTQQTPQYVGRAVEKIEDIAPSEVPMDGRMYFFPKNDQTCVFGKYWNKDGVLSNVTYAAQTVETPETKEDTTMVDILNRLSSIEEKINAIVD